MSTQATIRFDVEASTARLGPQLKAGEQQLRMFGQNARAGWAADPAAGAAASSAASSASARPWARSAA